MNHETWQDEFQGKVPHGHRRPTTDRIEREHYVARASLETGEPLGTPFSEADRERMREWKAEQELINQQGVENLCSMN